MCYDIFMPYEALFIAVTNRRPGLPETLAAAYYPGICLDTSGDFLADRTAGGIQRRASLESKII